MSWVADKFSVALRKHGYDTILGAQRAIDQSLISAFEFLGKKYDPEQHLVPRVGYVRSLDKFPEYLSGAPLEVKFDALHQTVLNRRHVFHRRVPPNEIHLWHAPEGSPYSSLDLPTIVRPLNAGNQQQMNFFPPGLSGQEMDQLAAKAVKDGLISESLRSLTPPDVYERNYTLAGALESNRDFFHRIGERSNVLHA